MLKDLRNTRDIGLYLAGSDFFPFLKTAHTSASFHLWGAVPLSIESWKMSVSIGAMSSAKVLRNQGGIWSGRQALLGFDEDSCFKNPCSEIMKDPKPGVGSAHFWNVLKVLRSKHTWKKCNITRSMENLYLQTAASNSFEFMIVLRARGTQQQLLAKFKILHQNMILRRSWKHFFIFFLAGKEELFRTPRMTLRKFPPPSQVWGSIPSLRTLCYHFPASSQIIHYVKN